MIHTHCIICDTEVETKSPAFVCPVCTTVQKVGEEYNTAVVNQKRDNWNKTKVA